MMKAQIIVVEDQAPTADLILEVLRSEGYDVQTVDTLAKARARLKKTPPELLRSEERRVGKECRSLCDWSSDVCSSDLGPHPRGPALRGLRRADRRHAR